MRHALPTVDARPHSLRPTETELRVRMEREFGIVSADSALAAYIFTTKLHADYIREHGVTPSAEITNGWKIPIDGCTRDAAAVSLHKTSFNTISKGSEGDKEREEHHGGEAAPSLQGSFGQEGKIVIWKISDVVEGTTALSRLEDGSSSAFALTEEDGILPTPEGSHYMVKLAGPKQLNEDSGISLDRPYAETIKRIVDVLDINPRQLTQVSMDPKTRPVNQEYVDAARALGVNVILIDAGDMLPGIFSALQPKDGRYTILAGRGGFEEGTITAAAMRALGGFMQAREWHKDPQEYANKPLWTLDDLVPGNKDTTVVTLTGITGDNRWLNIPQITRIGESGELYRAHTVTISSSGLRISDRITNANGKSAAL